MNDFSMMVAFIKPNLGGLFRGSFWGSQGGVTPTPLPPQRPPCLKLVRIMLETLNLTDKYTHIRSFRIYTF